MPDPERAERTRRAVLDAAAAEFDTYGYDGARLDRIVERTMLTKGAVYFHFTSKLALAEALVADKYALWPTVIEEVSAGGARGLIAAKSLTHRVADVLIQDVHARAAMKLTQTILPPGPEHDPYERWTHVIAGFLRQAVEDGALSSQSCPDDFARVAVHAFFGAYRIAEEMGRLDSLANDVERLWTVLGSAKG